MQCQTGALSVPRPAVVVIRCELLASCTRVIEDKTWKET